MPSVKQVLAATVGSITLGLGALTVGSLAPVGADPDRAGDSPDGPGRRGRVLREALAELVDAGTLTQAQADAVTAEVAERVAARPDGHGPRRRIVARAFETAAEAIGIEVDALRQAVEDGQTVGEVATANGVDPQAVVDALVTAGEAALEQAVADGRIDEERAAEIEAGLPAAAQRFVDRRR